MTQEQYQEKIQRLKKWAHAYYVEDNPIASDEEYDTLYHEVLEYETAHPEQVAEDSPTKRVGGIVQDEFPKRNTSNECGVWKMSLTVMR